MTNMTIIEYLKKELTFDEKNEILKELCGYSLEPALSHDLANQHFNIIDEEGEYAERCVILKGKWNMSTVIDIVKISERLAEDRGIFYGRINLQRELKKLLSIE